jgi:hypothetical protein
MKPVRPPKDFVEIITKLFFNLVSKVDIVSPEFKQK